MATTRKTPARSTSARSGSRAGKVVKAAGSSRPKRASKAPKAKAAAKSTRAPGRAAPAKPKPPVRPPAKPAAKSPAAKSPAAKSKPAAPVAAAPSSKKVPAPKPASGKPLPVKAKAVTPGAKGKTAEVRPLGVLPPENMVRTTHRPAPASSPAPPRPRAVTPPVKATGQGATRVTDQDLKEFETRLLEERHKILKEMGHLENTVLKVNPRDSAGDLSGYSFHMADAGTDAMEREKAFLFASNEGRVLMEIDAALRRLYRGEYGVCESCGNPIARARLEVMPQARLCIACKEKEERAQRGAV
jgi:DnaK suppressor protein